MLGSLQKQGVFPAGTGHEKIAGYYVTVDLLGAQGVDVAPCILLLI